MSIFAMVEHVFFRITNMAPRTDEEKGEEGETTPMSMLPTVGGGCGLDGGK